MDLIPHPHEIILGRQWSVATLKRQQCGHRVVDRTKAGGCRRCEEAKATKARKRNQLAPPWYVP